MNYKNDLSAVKTALRIHRERFKSGLRGTRFLLRETIFYRWECRGGRSKWQAPRFISKAARESERENWAYEHAIPLSIIFKKLEDLQNPSLESIRGVLEKWDIPVIVTKKESEELKKHGLQHEMPKGWAGLREPFARYLYCRIGQPVTLKQDK